MPELPEVQTIVAGLQPHIVDQTISGIEVLLPKSMWLGEERATGQKDIERIKAIVKAKKVVSITRRGKMIVVTLSDESILLIHLKMTGQLIYIGADQYRVAGGHPTADMVGQLPSKSTRVIVSLSNGAKLYFNDQRQFGYIKVLTQAALSQNKLYASFGPEPLESEFSEQYLQSILAKRSKLKVKQVLLDQSLIAGIGNIYADESLFLAKIHPARPAGSLTPAEVNALHQAIISVLRKGLEFGGTSSQHYVQSTGQAGTMQDHLMVYRKLDQPCLICGTPIERTVIGGRGTHYCPHCQPLSEFK